MKNLIILTAALVVFSAGAEAKFNPPDNYITGSEKTALLQISKYDTDNDGRLSVEEFEQKKNAKVTRETRKQIRQARRSGTYQEPNEQFQTIDTNQDGFITYQEMEKYISDQTRRTKGRVEYY